MVPPLAGTFSIAHLGAFDEAAMRTFLRPGPGGVPAGRLGTALAGTENDRLAGRAAGALPAAAAARLLAARAAAAVLDEAAVERARRDVVARLFWPLLYWHRPELYEELTAGEEVHPSLLDAVALDGRVVADLGAGAGRLTLVAARRAARVVAVDAVPQLLDRLVERCAERGIENVEARRGDLEALPLDDASVDIAVACSSLTSRAPFGGERAVREARRVVRPGGSVLVIWPDDPSWFLDRGFTYLSAPGPMSVRFTDVYRARCLCRDFYGAAAARWVVEHDTAEVPFEVLGISPPRDAALLHVGAPAGDELGVAPAPLHPGVETAPSG